MIKRHHLLYIHCCYNVAFNGLWFEALLSNDRSELYTVHCPEYERGGQEGCLHFFNMSAMGRVFLGCGGNPKKNMQVRVDCR
jgi:hypothetical protein